MRYVGLPFTVQHFHVIAFRSIMAALQARVVLFRYRPGCGNTEQPPSAKSGIRITASAPL